MSYQLYYTTYTAAMQTVTDVLLADGFTISDDDWFDYVNNGPHKPQPGKTISLNIPLYRNEVLTKKYVHVQVYNRGIDVNNAYELNMYHD